MANTKKYVSLDKLGLYDGKIKKFINDADTAVLNSATAYADSLASNYDAAGTAATKANAAEAAAKSYTDGKIAEVDGVVAGVKTIAEQGVANAATADGKAVAAQAAADAAQADIDALELLVGALPEGTTASTVVEYVNKKTEGIATDAALGELNSQVSGLQTTVQEIKGDYLKGTDKTELEGKINAKADQTALDAVSLVANAAVKQSDYDTKVAALVAEDERIAGLVATEAERAAGVESGLTGRIETMEAFWAAAQADGTDSNVIDTLKEIQDYIANDETGAANMLAAIEANEAAIGVNEAAISAMDAAYKAADSTLQGNIDALSGVVATKAAQADLTALDGRVTTAEGKVSANESAITALQNKDTELAGKITVLEGKFTGEGSVESMIATAKQEAIDAAKADAATDATNKANAAEAAAKGHADSLNTAMDARVAVVEAASATHALKTEVEAVAGRVTTVEGKVSTLETEMDAVEAKAAANETAIGTINTELAKKALASDLTAVGDRVTAIETWHANFVEVSEEEINALFTTQA